MQTLLPADELVALNLAFEDAHPRAILEWALVEAGFERIALASAFQAEGTIAMHLATRIRPDVPVLFLETGYQFAETLAFKERLTELLGLNVVDLVGEYTVERQAQEFGPRLFERDPELCCELNKVRPMFEALRGMDAWITAFRRDSSPTRANAPFVEQYELEPERFIVKINPMAAWSRAQVWGYLREHDLPHNPLYDLGYSSIGCAPCTRIRFADEPERAGRWAGLAKWECGIQTPPTPSDPTTV
ncbi:MAG TPA: phosphoadenylyl-sulfate reductase [Actinomycetota bacterium]|jgi:phosphoadenosine phosphosulfate reductase